MNTIKTGFVIFTGFFLFAVMNPLLEAQTSFTRGEELFMRNKPLEALPYLEKAAAEDPAHVRAFLYLGIAYLQMNRADDAIRVYTRILPRAGTETARVAYNMGNAYFIKGDYNSARNYYSRAIEENPGLASARLNRANTLVKSGELESALGDYEEYLFLEPESPKREQIMKLISFIREEFAEAERRRIMAEEAAKAAELARIQAEETARIETEMARIRAEEAARAEAERRRRLLEEVTESLQAAAEGSKGLSAGSEDVQDYEGEFVLE